MKSEYGEKCVLDYQGIPRTLVEEFQVTPGGATCLRVIPSRVENGEQKGRQEYVMREAKKDSQTEDARYFEGVIIANKVLTMRTDGIIVESLLDRKSVV